MSADNPTTSGATVVTGDEAPETRPDHTEAARVARAPETGRPSHDEPGAHGAHPTDVQYMGIALLLAVITGIEVGVYYIKGLGDAFAPILLILAAIKFFMVVAFFMHLKFDNPVLRRFMATGIALAAVLYTIVFFTLGIFTSKHGIHG